MDLKEYLDELFLQNKPIVMSKLVNLSNLNQFDVKLFTERWGTVNVERRQQIISKLEEMAETNPELVFDNIFKAALNDPDPTVRIKALDGLIESEDFHLIDPIIHLLKKDTTPAVQAAAAIALGSFALLAELDKLPAHSKTQIEQALLEVINSPTTDKDVKRRAIEAISPLSLPQVKELITRAYHNDDIKTRCSALYAMGRNSDPCWLSIVLAELNSSYPELRFEAVRACGELGDDEAIPYLIKLLGDSDIDVRTAVIAALGEIGGKEAKNALLACLEQADPSTKEAVEEALSILEFNEEPMLLSGEEYN